MIFFNVCQKGSFMRRRTNTVIQKKKYVIQFSIGIFELHSDLGVICLKKETTVIIAYL